MHALRQCIDQHPSPRDEEQKVVNHAIKSEFGRIRGAFHDEYPEQDFATELMCQGLESKFGSETIEMWTDRADAALQGICNSDTLSLCKTKSTPPPCPSGQMCMKPHDKTCPQGQECKPSGETACPSGTQCRPPPPQQPECPTGQECRDKNMTSCASDQKCAPMNSEICLQPKVCSTPLAKCPSGEEYKCVNATKAKHDEAIMKWLSVGLAAALGVAILVIIGLVVMKNRNGGNNYDDSNYDDSNYDDSNYYDDY